jgi:hypothetical protein
MNARVQYSKKTAPNAFDKLKEIKSSDGSTNYAKEALKKTSIGNFMKSNRSSKHVSIPQNSVRLLKDYRS